SCEAGTRAARLVDAVELAPLVKQHGLGRVQVLGLAGIDDAPAEAEHAPARITDGKHDAVTEAVVVALAPLPRGPLALDDQAGVGEALAIGVRGAEAAQHLVPGVGRVADREALDGLGGKSPLGEIVAGARFAPGTLRGEGRGARHPLVWRLVGRAGGPAPGRDFPRALQPGGRRALR